ncbi:MAG: methenyltetrahydromethanopterin cyclohydrolase [Bacillota bacterium]
MVSVNKVSMKLVRRIIAEADRLDVGVLKLPSGATVIDMGVERAGGWEAGRLFSELTMGGLATATFGRFMLGDVYLPSIDVYLDQPLIATFGCQIAGWQLSAGAFSSIGSGPARTQARITSDTYVHHISYQDRNAEVVLCLQMDALPTDELALAVAKGCGVKPADVYLPVASNTSITTSVQVSARSVEQTIHRLQEEGFPLNAILWAWGTAPVAPVCDDPLKTMGRINDALLYGAASDFWVRTTDAECERVVRRVVSEASRLYGQPFEAIFVQNNKDFYQIDHAIHAPARVHLHNVTTGKSFAAGQVHYKLLAETFLK